MIIKTMYEANWHYNGDENFSDTFSYCCVSPIKVTREGILPGCSGISIDAIDSQGRRFQGSPGKYFETEEAALDFIKERLSENIQADRNGIARLTADCDAMEEYLACLT
jgi:hypothetical protein